MNHLSFPFQSSSPVFHSNFVKCSLLDTGRGNLEGIADQVYGKYGKLTTIGWVKNEVEEVYRWRAVEPYRRVVVDEMLKSRYACLNMLSTVDVYIQYLEFRDNGGQRPRNSFIIKFIHILTASLTEQLGFLRFALLPLTLLSLPSKPENLLQSNFPTLTPPFNTLFDLGPDTLIPSPRPLIKLLCAQYGSP